MIETQLLVKVIEGQCNLLLTVCERNQTSSSHALNMIDNPYEVYPTPCMTLFDQNNSHLSESLSNPYHHTTVLGLVG
jgi:hypothetical protein